MLHLPRRKSIPPILLLAFTLLAAMQSLPQAALASVTKNILVLNSYSPGYKWTDEIINGVTEAVRKADGTVRLHHEFMDTKRISDAEYFRLLHDVYHYKFSKTRFDAVITSDNDAFDFMVRYRDELFPGVPVISCGVNNFDPSQLHGRKGFAVVNEAPDIPATLDLALKLHPNTKDLVVVNDTTTTGKALHSKLMTLLPKYQDRVRVVLLEDMEMQDLLKAVQALPEDSLILFIFFFRDKAGKLFEFDQAISMIAERTRAPIYGLWDFTLGYGMVGGKLTRGFDQGSIAGQLALRVLRGEDPDKIPFVMDTPNRYMFDYRQLRHFRIPASELPAGSIVINRPANRYSIPRQVIWGAAAALLLLVLIIALLLRNVAMKKQGEEKLRQLNEELEDRVRQRTEELEQSSRALKEQHRMLQETYRGLQLETEERIRVMEELRMKDQLLIHQSRMAAMGEMLGNIAHQWRQPLNVLGLMIQELGISYKMGRFSKELLDANVAKAMELLRHLSRTIDDFRTFSTPDKQKVEFKVDEVITKTVSLVAEGFGDQGISIETSCQGEPIVDGYPNEYAQVLLNILMNSRDAILERKVAEGRIEIRAWTENGKTVVTIGDNAGGIEESIMDRIFDAYFTTKELGQGTGVGLFMSKAIIEKNMGGLLTVRNAGGGAEFRITL